MIAVICRKLLTIRRYVFCEKYGGSQKVDIPISHLIILLNQFSLPLNGGYFILGSNQAGVFITAFW